MKQNLITLTLAFLVLFNFNLNAQTIRGDVNGDKQVTEADVTAIVDAIFGSTEVSKESADVNQDGVLNVVDVCTEVNIISDWKNITSTLKSGSTEDVIAMLENLSGTDQGDAGLVSAALMDNSNVEEVFTEDGYNVCVKTEEDDGFVMYPMYEMGSPFEEGSIDIPLNDEMSKAHFPGTRASTGYRGKVAIFNYFDGQNEQKSFLQQNIIVGYIKSKFHEHDYDVQYFGAKEDGDEKIFTQKNLEDVVSQSSQYQAIIIMSHGGLGEYGKSYIATRDKPIKDKNAFVFEDPYENKTRFRMIPVEETLRDVSNKCIVYIGACFGVPNGGFEKYSVSFPENTQSCAIAWEGRNSIAQAHAALFFHYLLYDGWDVVQALNALPQNDPKFFYSQMHFSQYGGGNYLDGKEELRPQFAAGVSAQVNTDYKYVIKTKMNEVSRSEELKISYRIYAREYPVVCRIFFKNILTGYTHQKEVVIVESNEEQFLNYDMSEVIDGCHDIYIEKKTPDGWKRVSLTSPAPILVSRNFNKMYALPVMADDQITPSIKSSDGQQVEEITLPVGCSETFDIDGYSGHTFKAPCLNKDVVTTSVNGTKLKVTGVSEGTTYIGVYDNQNKILSAVEVTVTANNTPEENAPAGVEAVDLGLPSGTLWANMNVGASKPEDYGDYFAWGETTPQSDNRYNWESYKWCNGSSSTLTKYCNNSSNGYNGFTDTKTVLDMEDDAARANWGGNWRMPTKAEFDELIANTTNEWMTQNGVSGRKFTSKTNSNSIFLPAAGERWSGVLDYAGSDGTYWSSSLYEGYPRSAWYLAFGSGYVNTYNGGYRSYGQSVRPVR